MKKELATEAQGHWERKKKSFFSVSRCLCGVLWVLLLVGCKRDIRLQALPALQGGQASLRVVLTYDRNNTLDLRLTDVRAPESYGGPYTRYVAWAQPSAGVAVNVGQIRVEQGKGRLWTLTPLRRFYLLITVEEKGDAQQPGPLVVFRTQKEKGTQIGADSR